MKFFILSSDDDLIRELTRLLQGKLEVSSKFTLNPGDRWDEAILRNFNEADCIIYLVTDYQHSGIDLYFEDLFDRMMQTFGTKRVVPLFVRQFVNEKAPYGMMALTSIREASLESAAFRLINSFGRK